MEQILKQILDELQHVNHRLDRLEKGQENLHTEQEKTRSGLDSLRVEQGRTQSGLESLTLGQESLRAEQERTQSRLDSLQLGQEKLQQGQEKLQLGLDQLKDNLINGLGPYFEQIEKHIEAKTDDIKDALKEQQGVIDVLAARSIKHESEIKEINRILSKN